MILAVVVALAPFSVAHIELDAPLVRYSNSPSEVNKHCPCGAGGGDDHCQNAVLTDLGGRDPARVTTFQAGQTITVRWRETVGHTGRYRISFSPDGATQEQFNAHPLMDTLADPAGATGNTGDGRNWAIDVTLPDTPCDNCVLQLIQDMGGQTGTPVGDLPNGHDLYFQCADIVLTGPAEGEGEGEGDIAVGEGEGEGDIAVGEGEGDVVGEGEGDVVVGEGEGEGEGGEGEEGEGVVGEGEGEGEGDDSVDTCGGCGATSSSMPLLGLALLLLRRRRR